MCKRRPLIYRAIESIAVVTQRTDELKALIRVWFVNSVVEALVVQMDQVSWQHRKLFDNKVLIGFHLLEGILCHQRCPQGICWVLLVVDL